MGMRGHILQHDERQPRLVVDFHHQGTYVDEEGRMITGSVMWPNAEAEAAAKA